MAVVALAGGGGGLKLYFQLQRSKVRAAVEREKAEVARQQAVDAAVTDNTAKLWEAIGELRAENRSLREELATLRREKHDALNLVGPLKIEVHVLKAEVNDLLEELDKPARYDLRPAPNNPA